jgi:hypothetical protein
VDSQILNWTNKACFREKLPPGSFDSKKLATSEISFTKLIVFQLPESADANLCHAVTATTCSLLNFMQVSFSRSELLECSNNTRITIVLRSDSLSKCRINNILSETVMVLVQSW